MIGAVTGLGAEAFLARRLGLLAAAGGGDAEGSERAIARLLASGVTGLVSFGIAGALAPGLATGSLLLPAVLRAPDGKSYWVDLDWHARLSAAARARNLTVAVGGVLGAAAPAATALDKARLHQTTGAIAVDLESQHVAAAAAHARMPFIVLRAVADRSDRDLPPAALLRLTPEGRADLLGVLGSIARKPEQLPALLAVAGETGVALWSLFRAGRALRRALLAP